MCSSPADIPSAQWSRSEIAVDRPWESLGRAAPRDFVYIYWDGEPLHEGFPPSIYTVSRD
jgi:hypothetical protein